uniref:IF rod domain-containing protein n=1 Tax=Callorhinchus milii TaxID=7868 RepID=A0A4W3GCL1_CALMI
MTLYSSKQTSASLSNLSLGGGYNKRNYGVALRSYRLGQAAPGGIGLAVGGRMAIKFSSGTGLGAGSSVGTVMAGGSGNLSNEKEAMQNLNNRLASYLSQVKSLESSNLTLAAKIKEFSKPKTLGGFDWSLYDTRVKALLKQVQVEMSLSVAADIESLRALKTQYLNLATQMESEISSLEADIAQLKEDHEKELSLLREQKGLNVHVGVSSAPAADLNKMLSDVRAEYEAMVRKQQEQTEAWYQKQVITEHRTSDGGEGMEAMKAEMMGYQRQVQTLRSELDSTAGSLADSLLKVELRYKEELSRYQRALSGLERELIELRNGTGQQSRQYQELLHIKSKLEAEISTYRGLLDTAGRYIIGDNPQIVTVSVGGSSPEASHL